MKKHWICCYDITNPKILAKTRALLSRYGLAINYSVFYLYIDEIEYQKIKKQLKALIQKKDDVRIYAGGNLQQAKHVGTCVHDGNHLINSKGILL